MCKAKIFSGDNTPEPPLKGKGRGGVERKGMKEWRREKDWGGERRGREGEKVGRGGKGSAERGEEGKGEEGRECEEEGGLGGSIASCSQGGRRHCP
jgi:hypothetical protein